MKQVSSARRLRVLVISPLYFPTEEGLAHYTTEFCRHLAKSADVSVLTSTASENVGSGPGGVEILPWIERWNLRGCLGPMKRALATKPDRILIQFVPFMYARRGGINFSIVALGALLAIRAAFAHEGRVQVMFHELWYHLSPDPKAVVMHSAHRAMVLGLSLAARDNFCATTRFAAEVERNMGPLHGRVHLLAVGSNLERDDAPLRERPPQEGKLRVALFGSVHSSKNVPLVLRALHEAALRAPGRLALTIIGLTQQDVTAIVPELADFLAENATIAGPLEARVAAATLAEQDFLVSYFQDGVSSRRGSLLAALCEGVPVVTTWNEVSDPVFLDQPSVKLLSCDEQKFKAELVHLLVGDERPFASVTAEDVRSFYRAHFSWAAIVERYLELSAA